MSRPLEIFLCYAHKDQEMVEELKTHLASLVREKRIILWSDADIGGGADWKEELDTHLENADIFLLLISPDFVASDHCYGIEMVQAMDRHERGSTQVIPVLLAPTIWENAPFARLQMLPTNARPVTEWANRRSAFHNVAVGISQTVSKIQNAKPVIKRTEPDTPFLPPLPIKKRRNIPPVIRWGVPILIVTLIISSVLLWSLLSHSSPLTAIGHGTVTLHDGESITIGISDGSSNFSFSTPKAKSDYRLPPKASGETCIYNANQLISTASYVTVVAVVSLSEISTDEGYSFGLGNATLQGFCQKQMAYNKDTTHPVKVRILVANIGVQDTSVLQQTMHTITQQLILLSTSDRTFIGAVGFTFSASLDDHTDIYNINTMNQLAKAGIPVISTAAATASFGNDWVGDFYRMNPGDDTEASVAAYYAYYIQHKKTATLFYDSTNPYSLSLEAAFSDDFPGTLQTENISNSNFTLPLQYLNNDPTDMIFCACVAASISPDFTKFAQALQNEPNLKGGRVMVMGADGLYNPEGRNIVYQDMFFTALAFPDTIWQYCTNTSAQCTSEQTNFYANYCQQFDPAVYNEHPVSHPSQCSQYGFERPGKSTMLAYDALSTLLWAYTDASPSSNSATPFYSTPLYENVRLALRQVKFQGITGWIQLSSSSGDPVNKMIVVVSVNSQHLGSVVAFCGEFTPTISNYDLSPHHSC